MVVYPIVHLFQLADLIYFIRLKQANPAGVQKALEQGLMLLHRTGLTMTEGILETGLLSIWFRSGRFNIDIRLRASYMRLDGRVASDVFDF